jgi:WD40 repeat protein
MKSNCRNLLLSTGLLFLLSLALLSGCAKKMPIIDLPEQYSVQRLGSVTKASPVAWHPDNNYYAVAASGLVIGQVNGSLFSVDRHAPKAISWSPTGAFLAASFGNSQKSTIRIFSFDGTALADVAVEGSVLDLGWTSDDELLIAAVTVKTFSFGGNYSVSLYRWRQNEELSQEVIADTSPLKSHLEAMGESIYNSVHLQISPFRDEIIYTRLLIPPNVDMHYQLVVRHLDSGREKVITKIPYGSQGGRYLLQGDNVFFSDGHYQSIKRSIWGTEAYETYKPGRFVEISPGGRYKLIDQNLLQDRDVLFSFAKVDKAAFSPDGSKLLFTSGRDLYLLSDLEDSPVQRVTVSQRLLELRRWRSEGLITPQEYEQYSRKLGGK